MSQMSFWGLWLFCPRFGHVRGKASSQEGAHVKQFFFPDIQFVIFYKYIYTVPNFRMKNNKMEVFKYVI